MVLEALAAVSLASAVFQFVDFASKLISKGNHYYTNADELFEYNTELEASTKGLELITENLKDCRSSLAHHTGYSKPVKVSNEELALRKLAGQCSKKVREFDRLLTSMKVQGPHGRWKSFRQAAKEHWGRDGVQQMRQSLGTIREDLIIHLLVVLE